MILVALLIAHGLGDDAIAKARAKYDAVAYDEAIAILDKALASPGVSSSEKARVLAFEALVHAQMADDVAAKKNLDDAIALDQCVLIPDAPAPPKIKAMLSAEREAHVKGIATPLPVVPAATSPSSPTSTNGTSPLLPIGATLAGAGVVAWIGGGAFGALGLAQHDAAATAQFQSDVIANDANAEQNFVVANVLLVGGAACVVVGGVVAIVGALE